MNNHSQKRPNFVLSFSLVGISILINSIQVTTFANEEPTTPIDDGARYLRGLERPSSSAWDFAVGGANPTQKQEDYQLSLDRANVKIIEQDRQQWRNTGEDEDYSVLVDFDNLLEEEEQ